MNNCHPQLRSCSHQGESYCLFCFCTMFLGFRRPEQLAYISEQDLTVCAHLKAALPALQGLGGGAGECIGKSVINFQIDKPLTNVRPCILHSARHAEIQQTKC